MNRIFSRITLNKKVLSYNFCTDVRPSDGCHDRRTIEMTQSKAMLQRSLARNQPVTVPLKKYDNTYAFKRHHLLYHTSATVYGVQNFLWNKNNSILYKINLRKSSYNSIRYFSGKEILSEFGDTLGSNPREGNLNFITQMLCEDFPVEFIKNAMVNVHEWSGLPWWANIVIMAVLCKVALFPVMIYEKIILARLVNVNEQQEKDMDKIVLNSVILGRKHMWPPSHVHEYQKKAIHKNWQELVASNNCHPMKVFIIHFMSMITFMILSLSLGSLIYMPPTEHSALAYYQLAKEGFGWVKDLTVADRFSILSLVWLATNVMNIQIQKKLTNVKSRKSQLIQYGITIVFLPITIYVPSGILLLWVVSGFLSTGQMFILNCPRVRKFCGIPKSKLEDIKLLTIFDGIKRK